MRWSEWRTQPPVKEAAAPRVLAAVDSVLATLGGDLDGECWVVWGEDAIIKWSMLMPTTSGLLSLSVRPVSQDGARVSGKLVRWPRVQIGEFSVDYQAGHKVVALSVEGTVLRGVDAEADAIGDFLQSLYAAIDGRTGIPVVAAEPARRRPARAKGSRPAAAAAVALVPIEAAEPVAGLLPEDDEDLPDFLSRLSSPEAMQALSSGKPGAGLEAATALPRPAAPPAPAMAPLPARPAAPAPAALPPAPAPDQASARPVRPPTLEPPAGPLGRRLADAISTPDPAPGRRPGQGGR